MDVMEWIWTEILTWDLITQLELVGKKYKQLIFKNLNSNTVSIQSSSDYGGKEPDSEEETKALIKLLQFNHHRVKAALFLHSFSQLWLSPYGIRSSNPEEYPEMVGY